MDDLHTHFCIPLSISMRVLGEGELLRHACEELDEISVPVVALECRVRLPLTLFVRKVLIEFPLHLL